MRKATKIIIGAVTLTLIVWDIFAYYLGNNATISVFITDNSLYSPWMPFAFGFLMGHFFAPAKGSIDT